MKYTSYGPSSERLGGLKRSREAIRDEHGRFMPTDPEQFEQWKLDQEHGKPGGKTRAQSAKRNRGKFTKDE